MGNAELRKRFGQESLRRVERHFTWRRVASAINDVYQEVVAEQTASPIQRLAGGLATLIERTNASASRGIAKP
jgi:hypothetical protein